MRRLSALASVTAIGGALMLAACGSSKPISTPTGPGGVPVLNLTQGGKGLASCVLDSKHRARATFNGKNTGSVSQTLFATIAFLNERTGAKLGQATATIPELAPGRSATANALGPVVPKETKVRCELLVTGGRE